MMFEKRYLKVVRAILFMAFFALTANVFAQSKEENATNRSAYENAINWKIVESVGNEQNFAEPVLDGFDAEVQTLKSNFQVSYSYETITSIRIVGDVINLKTIDPNDVSYIRSCCKLVVNNKLVDIPRNKLSAKTLSDFIKANEDSYLFFRAILHLVGDTETEVVMLVKSRFLEIDENLNIKKLPHVVSNPFMLYAPREFEKIDFQASKNLGKTNSKVKSGFHPLVVAQGTYENGEIIAKKGEMIGKVGLAPYRISSMETAFAKKESLESVKEFYNSLSADELQEFRSPFFINIVKDSFVPLNIDNDANVADIKIYNDYVKWNNKYFPLEVVPLPLSEICEMVDSGEGFGYFEFYVSYGSVVQWGKMIIPLKFIEVDNFLDIKKFPKVISKYLVVNSTGEEGSIDLKKTGIYRTGSRSNRDYGFHLMFLSDDKEKTRTPIGMVSLGKPYPALRQVGSIVLL
ncbi:MAG: hypothetical protein ACOX3T_04000 [Bdellovibrionota bacterium]